MSELHALQNRFWTPFVQQLELGDELFRHPAYDDRNLKFKVFGTRCWIETIVNFGHSNGHDQSVAVALVIQPESEYQLKREPSIQDVIEIEGDDLILRWWSDETVEGRRTIKLSRVAPSIRESSNDWLSLRDWLNAVLLRFYQVFERILTIGDSTNSLRT